MTRKVKEQGAHLVEGAAAAAKKAAAEKAKSMIDDGTRHAEEFVEKGADRARDKLDYYVVTVFFGTSVGGDVPGGTRGGGGGQGGETDAGEGGGEGECQCGGGGGGVGGRRRRPVIK